MEAAAIVRRRLRNLGLWGRPSGGPVEVVGRLGALQGQEFAYALWSVAQRSKGADDSEMRKLFDEGAILRTHLLRPTWHLVTASDIRWVLKVTAQRVHQQNAHRYRELGIDAREMRRCNRLLAKELAGGSHLTRKEIGVLLEGVGIDVAGQRLPYFLMQAELDAVICSGAMRGKQQTYALLEERAPEAIELDAGDALAELTRRYFTTRGPATVRDYARWSSLTMGDCRRGIEMLDGALSAEEAGDRTYWFVPSSAGRAPSSPRFDLIQVYDEYVMSYSESRDVIGGEIPSRESAFWHGVLLDGRLIGHWKRTEKGKLTTIETDLFRPLKRAEKGAFEDAVERYAKFLGKPVNFSAEPSNSLG